MVINTALAQSKADKQYHDASEAFDRGDMQSALDNFFLAIHSRYDIEKPLAKRFIRRKLNTVNLLREENDRLREVIRQKDEEKKNKRISSRNSPQSITSWARNARKRA